MNANNTPTAEDFALAEKVAAWMVSLSETAQTSDFLYNLGIYGKADMVTTRGIGLVASAVVSFNRDLAKKVERETFPPVSMHVGDVKGHLHLKVRLLMQLECSNMYGVSYMHKFQVMEGEFKGAQLVWFGSHRLWTTVPSTEVEGALDTKRYEQGDEMWIVGTVKAHGDYQGMKQTMLVRVASQVSPDELVELEARLKAEKKAKAKADRDAKKAAKQDLTPVIG